MMGLMAEPLLAEQTEHERWRDFGTWMTSEQRRIYGIVPAFFAGSGRGGFGDTGCISQGLSGA